MVDKLQKHIEEEDQRQKTENVIITDLRRLFEFNGGHSLINLPTVAPMPCERTLFLSKAIRLLKWLPDFTA